MPLPRGRARRSGETILEAVERDVADRLARQRLQYDPGVVLAPAEMAALPVQKVGKASLAISPASRIGPSATKAGS